jgi:DNA-binding LacI/PurR family transcriptional regulator
VYQRGTSYATRFLTGFNDAVAQYELNAVTGSCGATFDGVTECMGRIDAELPNVTGLVVHNESALAPLLDILRARGQKVPDDVSIVAVCPPDFALGLPIPITSVDIPAHAIGTLAVDMVMGLLDGRRGPETRLLSPHLTERASCVDAPA